MTNLYINSASSFVYEVYDGSAKAVVFSPGITGSNGAFKTYTTIMTCKNSDKLRTYIDGRYIGDVSVGTLADQIAPVIGAKLDGTTPFKGKINRVRFWNRSLSPIEISKIYAFNNTTKFRYPMDINEYCNSLTGPLHFWNSAFAGTSKIDFISGSALPGKITAKSAIKLTHKDANDTPILQFLE